MSSSVRNEIWSGVSFGLEKKNPKNYKLRNILIIPWFLQFVFFCMFVSTKRKNCRKMQCGFNNFIAQGHETYLGLQSHCLNRFICFIIQLIWLHYIHFLVTYVVIIHFAEFKQLLWLRNIINIIEYEKLNTGSLDCQENRSPQIYNAGVVLHLWFEYFLFFAVNEIFQFPAIRLTLWNIPTNELNLKIFYFRYLYSLIHHNS